MGCCAHVAASIWWLGNGQLRDVVFYNGMWFNLRDAAGDQSHLGVFNIKQMGIDTIPTSLPVESAP
jgi:hypothetical protein